MREAFCKKKVVDKLSEPDDTFDGTADKWWHVAAYYIGESSEERK